MAVCGLKREAKIVSSKKTNAFYGDGDRIRLSLNYALRDAYYEAIISFGIAGALAPELKPGDIVVGERVIWDGGARETDPAWRARLINALPKARAGTILGQSTIATAARVKAELRQSTGADLVDMESHIAAKINLPFVALRVVSDAADRTLPPATLVAMRPNGTVSLGRVLWSVLKQPSQIPSLLRTGRESERAFAALLHCRKSLGPNLGWPYRGRR
jgi:hopanoid-associated phosphorylase